MGSSHMEYLFEVKASVDKALDRFADLVCAYLMFSLAFLVIYPQL